MNRVRTRQSLGRLVATGLTTVILLATASQAGEIVFNPPTSYGVGTFPTSVASALINADAYIDLVVTNAEADSLSVLFNAGDGTFSSSATYATGAGPFAVAVADLDGDNDTDIAVANKDGDTVSVFFNNGDGSLTPGPTLAVGADPRSLVAVDLDHDDDVDIAVSNRDSDTVSVLINLGNGAFAPAVNYLAGSNLRQLVAAHLDGDTHLDLAVVSHNTISVSILIGAGDGTFAAPVAIPLGGTEKPDAVAVGELNGDGIPDLAVAIEGASGGSVLILTNDGNAGFGLLTTLPTGVDPAAVRIGDLDGDLLEDIVVANRQANTVSTYRNLGDGSFAAPGSLPSGNDPYYIALADFSNDGRLDIASPNSIDNQLAVLINQTTPIPGDVDGNGLVDLNDLMPFVVVLLDPAAATPAERRAADINLDDIADGNDVPFFTFLLLE